MSDSRIFTLTNIKKTQEAMYQPEGLIAEIKAFVEM